MTGGKRFGTWILTTLTLVLLVPTTLSAAASQAEIREESLVIPTYPVGAPDPNPRFYEGRVYQGAQGRIYPYPMSDTLIDTLRDQTYRAVFLENEFIRICVLPEIGGRIFSAVDKTNRYEFFYHQHVIKPALIGMLGAWISGGVEWNIPHHHRATTFMPMDYTIAENPDGSKTLWLGEIERRHRLRFLIGITVYPGKSYIEVSPKIFNRTPFEHSFLFWANPSVHVDPTYQVIFPPDTEYVTQHAKREFSEWPISNSRYGGHQYQGTDISWWKNLPEPVSFFCWDSEADYFGGYNHGKNAGVAYVADHYVAPGKKFFAWGNGTTGNMWDKMLSDADGPYLEIMAGAYSDNQPDYSWSRPYEVKTFKQYWYPIRELEGLKYANLEGALNLELTPESKAKIRLNTTSAFTGGKIVLQNNEKTLFEQTVDISPEHPFVKDVAVPQGVKEEDLFFRFSDSQGKELIRYQPVPKPGKPKPARVEPPPAPKEIKTNEELYLAGLRLDQFYNANLDSVPYYEEALRRDPGDSRVNTQLGILYCERGLFAEAEEKLNAAIARLSHNYTHPKEGEPYYYLGVALEAQKKYDAAYTAFYQATWSSAWHSAGYFSLAELDCRKGEYMKALEHLDRSLSTNALNTKALNLKSAVLRALERLEEAEQPALQVLAIDPLDAWAGNELYWVKKTGGKAEEADRQLKNWSAAMRGDPQSYLELATDYGNGGFPQAAVDVLLRRVRDVKTEGGQYPMLYYYLGYYYEQLGESEKAADYYQQASRMPPDYCFPFRLESMDVLQQAMAKNPKDAKAPYYLGNLLYDWQPEKAIQFWEKSRELDDAFYLAHRNLGYAYSHAQNDIPKAMNAMEKAVACNKKDPHVFYELDLLYETAGVAPQKRLALLEKNQKTVLQRDDALSREIRLQVQVGRYDQAVQQLTHRHFHTWEGGGSIHDLYVEAFLLRGLEKISKNKFAEALKDYVKASEFPDNLEVGKPLRDEKNARTDYYIGEAYARLGQTDSSAEYFRKAAEENVGRGEYRYYKGMSQLRLGNKEEAKKIFDDLIRVGQESLKREASIDFFAKFGEKQSFDNRQANAHFLMGLGYAGNGERAQAKSEFEAALKLNVNHLWAKVLASEIQ